MSEKVLVVGLLCVDVINYVDEYPKEDSDENCKDQILTTGGNAGNSCKVLKQLGCEDCVLFSALSSPVEDWASQVAESHMKSLSINISKCPVRNNQRMSVAVIVVNESNGSRTILHHKKGLREPTVDEFLSIFSGENLHEFGWIHFEGRSTKEVRSMIEYILKWKRERNAEIPIVSVELEKCKPALKDLAVGVDCVFVGKDFAKFCGYYDMIAAARGLATFYVGANVICAWGDQGACVVTKENQLFQCPAVAPDRVIDTVGAGDTFIAACISCLVKRQSYQEALNFGCRVAGAKCCVKGYFGFDKYL